MQNIFRNNFKYLFMRTNNFLFYAKIYFPKGKLSKYSLMSLGQVLDSQKIITFFLMAVLRYLNSNIICIKCEC